MKYLNQDLSLKAWTNNNDIVSGSALFVPLVLCFCMQTTKKNIILTDLSGQWVQTSFLGSSGQSKQRKIRYNV